MQRRQTGFTLVEIAIVLVIIGLLLGGVLKGQELIASARVRNLADQQSGIQAAYFGFQDRYRAIPGDMSGSEAAAAIGVDPKDYPGGDQDGRLEDPGDSANWTELNAVWAHLSDADFINGSYVGSGAAPKPGNKDVSPLNVFSSPVILAFAKKDKFESGSAQRLVLFTGNNVPVDIARELDVKVDDGKPSSGSLRNASSASDPSVYQSASGCIATDSNNADLNQWDIQGNEQNCNPVFLF